MILQKLYLYYQRLNQNSESEIAPPGYSTEKIHFAIVINKKGEVVRVMDLRETDGKKKYPKLLVVPQIFQKRTSGKKANFLWDNSKYVLGIDKEKSQDALECFEIFKLYHAEMGKNCVDEGYKALLLFLEKWKPENIENLDYKEDIPGSNIVFKFEDDANIFLHERSALKQLLMKIRSQNETATVSQCLVSGEDQPIPNIHPSIKGVKGAQSSGAAIVSFNIDSFNSYNKKQNFNAPIGETAAFSYTTALNHLLDRNSRQKIQIGDTTTVFWAERQSPIEDFFGMALDPESTFGSDNKEVFDFLNAARDGKKIEKIDPEIGFYILGLAPNASRIAVRFWYASTVGEIENALGQHYSDMRIDRNFPEKENEYPGIWRLLKETAVLGKSDNINPNLSGAFVRSILTGDYYPYEILSETLERVHADGDVNYYRASLIKGYLSRKYRKRNLRLEVNMSLNTGLKDPGYLLGRLFAVIEKVQEEANPGLNATIKDRYFSSASATPRAIFPQLIRLSQYHFAKLDSGRKTNMEKLVQEIVDDVDTFPAHLDMEEQGMFVLGYYQQRKDLFTSKKENLKGE
ncbi:MAG: type I-C CRISPR-associated protein Cas8c/Csd1 [Thermotogae bacterium]|jgi:CRISPR-associated protein Csd1|nr:type I-C CRISPR-associated protein Cas8c/Csd1 [Thermotogota bacterium]MCL5032192.1 type I-C CRISPR-associated protein Cas8c/Csd1 [Thermotogota bacterium]